jgi:hypothetical protein
MREWILWESHGQPGAHDVLDLLISAQVLPSGDQELGIHTKDTLGAESEA